MNTFFFLMYYNLKILFKINLHMEIKNTMIDVLYCFLNAISNIKTTKIIFNEI